jgi:hypothetical protein
MEFLQHFLLGKPLERNGQESVGLMSTLVWDEREDRLLVAGLDLELADSFLLQQQDGPTTDGTPPANAIRPAGKHYDSSVRSHVAALYVHGERRLGERLTDLLSRDEVEVTRSRVVALRRRGTLPVPSGPNPYPWPLL